MTRFNRCGNILDNDDGFDFNHGADVLEQFGEGVDEFGFGGGHDFDDGFAEFELDLVQFVFEEADVLSVDAGVDCESVDFELQVFF